MATAKDPEINPQNFGPEDETHATAQGIPPVSPTQTTSNDANTQSAPVCVEQDSGKALDQCACCRRYIKTVVEELKLETRDATSDGAEGPQAWTSLSRHTKDLDEVKIDRWNKQIDTLLVYAALFSAIIAAFNIEFYKQLVPDPQKDGSSKAAARAAEQMAAQMAAQMARANLLLLAIATGNTSNIPIAPLEVPAINVNTTGSGSPANKTTNLPLVYNSLWFLSLIIALIAASLATLVKQWLMRYLDQDLDSSPREHVRLRQHRYNGLKHRWGTPLIIGLLPVLLRISFILFLSGLVVELYMLNHHLTIIVAVLGGLWALVYILTSLIPAFIPDCPYKSPESLLIYNIWAFFAYVFLLPFNREIRIKWCDWRDQEVSATESPERASQLEMEALVAVSVDLALSDRSLADLIEKCTRDLNPDMAMNLVNQIAHRRMFRFTHSNPKLEWRRLWDFAGEYPDPNRDRRYHKITAEGTKTLMSIAIDAALHPKAKPETADQAIACVTTLLTYLPAHESNSPNAAFDKRLAELVLWALNHVKMTNEPRDGKKDNSNNRSEGSLFSWAWGRFRRREESETPNVPADSEARDANDLMFKIFNIIYCRPGLCEHLDGHKEKYSLPPKEIMELLLVNASAGDIYKEAVSFERYEYKAVCNIIYTLVEQIGTADISKSLQEFIRLWKSLLDRLPESADVEGAQSYLKRMETLFPSAEVNKTSNSQN